LATRCVEVDEASNDVIHNVRIADYLSSIQETAEKMMKTTVPAEHQALGRKAKGFSRAVWDQRE